MQLLSVHAAAFLWSDHLTRKALIAGTTDDDARVALIAVREEMQSLIPQRVTRNEKGATFVVSMSQMSTKGYVCKPEVLLGSRSKRTRSAILSRVGITSFMTNGNAIASARTIPILYGVRLPRIKFKGHDLGTSTIMK